MGCSDGSVPGGGGGGAAMEATGCDGVPLLAAPADPAARGPWTVGARTVTMSGLKAEVWYPARPGSAGGASKITYDIREHLPPAEASKIPDADNPPQPCDCFRDLPIDDQHGPYPLVVFIHGIPAASKLPASVASLGPIPAHVTLPIACGRITRPT